MRLITMLNKNEKTIIIDMRYEKQGNNKTIEIDGYCIEENRVSNEQDALKSVYALLIRKFVKDDTIKMKVNTSNDKVYKWFIAMLKLKINDISEKQQLCKIEMF